MGTGRDIEMSEEEFINILKMGDLKSGLMP
jgi:hypothetical protein